MMGFADLPISFWGYALESACYILNKVPSKSVNKTPHEMWTGRKPMLSHLRVWGCPAYVKHLKTDKLEPYLECSRLTQVHIPKRIWAD